MSLDILAAILVTATIQSLFGVGVLLFGTPILLVLGYPFVTALAVLLPISCSINLLQVSRYHAHIDRSFYGKILSLSAPGIVVCLLLVTRAAINIGFLVGLFLILVALKDVCEPVKRWIESLVRYERTYFVAMGIIHGLTNLGGSLLTAIVHSKHYEKDVQRVTTAVAYGNFAFFQLLTLLVALDRFPIPFTESALAVLAGVGTYLLTDQLVYAKIGAAQYRTVFAALLFVSGTVLILKAALMR
ncbi:MAG: hypothetical protein FJ245_03635 [Nitrospira sp.]|nr:hypothetical protein [Nitrospira sp.]